MCRLVVGDVSVWLLLLTSGTSFTIPRLHLTKQNIRIGTKLETGWCVQQLVQQRYPIQIQYHAVTTTTNDSTNDRIPNNVKLLILPGFGNVMEDYILSSNPNDPYDTSIIGRTGSLLQSFVNRGWTYQDNIFILPIQQRYEWIQVFVYGLFDIQFLFYSNAPPTNPAFRWYLQKIHSMIHEQIVPSSSCTPLDEKKKNTTTATTEIVFIGHSAGGWLGRAAIAYLLQQQQQQQSQVTSSFSTSDDPQFIIRGLVTLGTPNLPPPISAMDMTRGALRYTDTHYPGAFQHYYNRTSTHNIHQQQKENDEYATINTEKNNTIFYVTVCGNSIQGQKNEEGTARATSDTRTSAATPTPLTPPPSTQMSRFAYNSYEAVCGDGTTDGDGVVPICSAHLRDAIQITLPNIYHSINVPEQWYGTDTVSAFDIWYNCMMEQINRKKE